MKGFGVIETRRIAPTSLSGAGSVWRGFLFMPSDFAPIAQTACVSCGRPSITVSNSGIPLKPLDTYSRAFSCITCFVRYSNCANCHHERHPSAPIVVLLRPRKTGKCYCGCDNYQHGLAAEFDRQFAVHTGKTPNLQCARGCGRYRTKLSNGLVPLECSECRKEYRELVNG